MCNTLTRREFSAGVAATTVALAGCTDTGSDDVPANETGDEPVVGNTENTDGTTQSGEIEATTESESVTTTGNETTESESATTTDDATNETTTNDDST